MKKIQLSMETMPEIIKLLGKNVERVGGDGTYLILAWWVDDKATGLPICIHPTEWLIIKKNGTMMVFTDTQKKFLEGKGVCKHA